MPKRSTSKPKNLAKAALMSPIFRQKEHGKSNKHYDRKKEKKVDLREKILDRLNETKLTNDEFNKDAKTYKTADNKTRIALEKKWGARSTYFVGSNDHKNVKEEIERKSTRNVKINGEWHDEIAKKMDGTKVTHVKTRDGKWHPIENVEKRS